MRLTALNRLARDNRGAIAVLAVTSFIPIGVGAAALSLDVSRWYEKAAQIQSAADAAALAGVAHMPTSPAHAYDTAKRVARANGYTAGDGHTVAVTPATRPQPTELQVTITATVDNPFGKLLGRPSQTITRRATAEYTAPVALGSPCNALGQQPAAGWTGGGGRVPGPYVGAACPGGRQPRMWAEVAGPDTDKAWGAAYDSRSCATGGTDHCAGSTNPDYNRIAELGPIGDRAKQGVFYRIEVKQAGALRLELFDPGLVAVGSTCEHLPNRWGGGARPNRYTRDAGARYAGGANARDTDGIRICVGDHDYGQRDRVNNRSATTFALRAPGIAPDPTASPVICVRQYGGWSHDDYREWATERNRRYKPELARNWRQWVSPCGDVPVSPGVYYLQVRTDIRRGAASPAAMDDKRDLRARWAGKNGFAIRASVSGNPNAVTVGANGYMTVALNQGGTGRFHMARIGSSYAGLEMMFSMFDLGDISDGRTGQVQLLAPPDATGFPGGTIPSCLGTGRVNGNLPGCILPNINFNRFNARWQTLTVRMPADYRCNDADPNACWFRINVTYTGSGTVFDTSSWETSQNLNPIRLIG